MTSRRSLRRAGALALGLLTGGILAIAAPLAMTPAQAASGDILISQDGVNWSKGLGTNIFDTSRMLVPGDSLQGSFYVRNDHDFPAYLRVGLSSLTVTDWTLAQALTMTTIGTGASGASGTAAAFSGAGVVCSDLLQREDPVPPGGVVLVSADLLFRQSTSGTTAQGQIAQIAFIVELSDVDLNTFGQPLCSNSAQIGPVTPTAPPTSGGGSGGTTPAPDGTTGGGSGTQPGGTTAGGPGTTAGSDQAGAPGSTTGAGSAFDRPAAAGTIEVDGVIGVDAFFYNTVRWWEEYAILILIGAALLGMLGRAMIDRRHDGRAGMVEQA